MAKEKPRGQIRRKDKVPVGGAACLDRVPGFTSLYAVDVPFWGLVAYHRQPPFSLAGSDRWGKVQLDC